VSQQLPGEVRCQSHGEDFRSFRGEVDLIRLIIIGGEHGRIHGNQRFHTLPL